IPIYSVATHEVSPQFSTLSLHDALPISFRARVSLRCCAWRAPAVPIPSRLERRESTARHLRSQPPSPSPRRRPKKALRRRSPIRSEEHTSELQSRENLVCRHLLEKKNQI